MPCCVIKGYASANQIVEGRVLNKGCRVRFMWDQKGISWGMSLSPEGGLSFRLVPERHVQSHLKQLMITVDDDQSSFVTMTSECRISMFLFKVSISVGTLPDVVVPVERLERLPI